MSLYIVGTSIGNLEDITLRALNTLKSVDIVALESYNDTIKLLNHYEIKPKKIIKYNDRNKEKLIPEIINELKDHDVAYLTSAGMPGVSDPGTELVQKCYENDIDVIPIPGPSALTTAIAMSGIKGKRVMFIGFMPRKKSRIEKLLQDYLVSDSVVVFFESPFRILKSLEVIRDFNPNIKVFIGREMTKKFETYVQGDIDEIIKMIQDDKNMQKGEFSIVITQDH